MSTPKKSEAKFALRCTVISTGEAYVRYPDGLPEPIIDRTIQDCSKLWPHIRFEKQPITQPINP